MQRVLTVCPHCGAGCGLYLLVDREEVIGVTPSAGHPVSRGSLCMRGWTSFQHLRRPERLEFPRIRLNGTLTRASWEEAFTHLVAGLKGVCLKNTGEAIGIWASGSITNEELFLLRRIASEGLHTRSVHFDPSLHTLGHIPAALVEGPHAARLEEIHAADLLVILGHGLEEHHPQVASRILRAMDRGTRGIVISPRRDLLAKHATLHLLLPFPDEVAPSLTSGGDGSLESLRRLWGEAKQRILIYPLKSLPLFRELNLLSAFQGLVAEEGTKVLLLFPRANSRGAFRQRLGSPPQGVPELKALMVVEEDPAGWNPASREMIQDLEFLVVQDRFLTQTAELAHVVLPSASFAEKEGTLTNTEGRDQALQAAVPPPGEARPGWVILAELARCLGVRDVGSTLEEIQNAMTSDQMTPAPAEPVDELVTTAATGHSNFQHLPDRLGWMWIKDAVLRHTEDWQRERQDRWIEVHPEDAKQLGFRPGWTVRVTGEGGVFQAVVRVSERVGRGILVTPHELIEGSVHLERAA